MADKKTTKLRKKKDVEEKIEEERSKKVPEKKKADANWFRHWEKEGDGKEEEVKGKKLDGNKRPKPFSYKEDE